MILKKAINDLMNSWTKDLNNEEMGELIRALLHYEQHGNTDDLEMSPVVRVLVQSVFIPKMQSLKKESDRHKGYRKGGK